MVSPVSTGARRHRPGSSLVADALAENRLGTSTLVIITMSAATPLTVVAGVVTTGYATTGVTGIPLAFLVVGAILGVFAAGYVAMARQISNAGAFYSFIAAGLSRRVGVGAAWLALLSYNALQVALYGIVGTAAAPVAAQFLNLSAPWWAYALAAWALTTVLGQLKVDLNGRILALLVGAEVAVIAVYSLADLISPSPEGLSTATLTPDALTGPGLGALLVLAVLGFVGFEAAAVYSEEARDRTRTVPRATYCAIALTGVLYAFSSWAMSVATGPTAIVSAAQTEGADLIFTLAADRLGPAAADLGHLLFVTSVIAALISFHNTVARYTFALGRERVLPAALGRTSARTSAPHVASAVQSGTGLVVIGVYAIAGWDPLVTLFYWVGTSGGIGILTLLVLTSAAIVRFFARTPSTETLWAALFAPLLAFLALTTMLVLALQNLDVLLGVPTGHPLTWLIPAGIAVVLTAGALWASLLKSTRPHVFAVIGLGPDAARTTPEVTR